MGHAYIYLGVENGEPHIFKVGQTGSTCWHRCSHDNYLIGVGFDIECYPGCNLNTVERHIVTAFSERFEVAHGREYFYAPKHNWEQIKEFFINEMENFLWSRGMRFDLHTGWVAPYTY